MLEENLMPKEEKKNGTRDETFEEWLGEHLSDGCFIVDEDTIKSDFKLYKQVNYLQKMIEDQIMYIQSLKTQLEEEENVFKTNDRKTTKCEQQRYGQLIDKSFITLVMKKDMHQSRDRTSRRIQPKEGIEKVIDEVYLLMRRPSTRSEYNRNKKENNKEEQLTKEICISIESGKQQQKVWKPREP